MRNPLRRHIVRTLLLAGASATLAMAPAAWAQQSAPAQADQAASKAAAQPRVKLQTSMGDIVVELDAAKAPKTVENFLQYVDDKHYDGTIFHRVIDGFMIQGGGFTEDMTQKTTRAPIVLEADNRSPNLRGTIAMARTMQPHSASAQFFINVKDNDFLNHTKPDLHGWGYAVFGKVVEGTEVVDEIKGVKTGNRAGHQDVPVDTVVINKAEIV